MSVGRFLQQGAAGNAGEAVYVDDVFSTYLYDGTGSAQTITNGIDVDGEGGLVWIKGRTQNIATQDHRLVDTARGVNQAVSSSTNDNVLNITGEFTSFNSDGFTLAATSGNGLNRSGEQYCSWTFRNQPGFFQVLTYEGNGTAGRTVSHSLGSVPGCIMVKAAESGVGFNGDWLVYHRGNTAAPETDHLILNSTAATADSSNFWNDTAPTATEFTLGASNDVNGNGVTYVAYLFAHDAQDFGTNSDEAIIKCESISHTSGTYHEVDLGFEPQFILYKCSSSVSNWEIFDSMRGLENAESSTTHPYLKPAESSAEAFAGSQGRYKKATPTGFITREAKTATYIYIAIRRPHKPAEEFAATDLFDPVVGQTSGKPNYSSSTAVVDAVLRSVKTSDSGYPQLASRLTGNQYLITHSGAAESTFPSATTKFHFAMNDGWGDNIGGTSTNVFVYMFRRAPGFFDVVVSSGQSGYNTINHNLGVAPELAICKARDYSPGQEWYIWVPSEGVEKALNFDTGAIETHPYLKNFTATTMDTNLGGGVYSYIYYLFASSPGISKVGSYTGTGANLDVDCGFTSGARLVLVKRLDSTGDWYAWDAENGIVAGNDPYKLLNSYNAAQVTNTDYIDPLSSGFTITSSAPAALNASGGSYLFLAIA